MTNIETLCYFLGITKKTWYNWKTEGRPLTIFIERYLSHEDINEFIKTKKINRFENLEVINEIYFKKYNSFINPLINTSFDYLNSIPLEEYLEDVESYFFTNIPIFLFFEYLFEARSEFDVSLFSKEILKILFYYRINIESLNSDIHDVFKVDDEILDIFYVLNNQKNFNTYYKYNSDSLLSNKHAYLENFYHQIKSIQSKNDSYVKTNDNLVDLLLNSINSYNAKKCYFIKNGE